MLLSLVLFFPLTTAGGQAGSTQIPQTEIGTAPSQATISVVNIADLEKRAGGGDASAEFEVGKAFEEGKGVAQNPEQAAVWYRKAADHGNAQAQNSLGVLYWMGEGVVKDRKEAVKWYHLAAQRGDASAMFNLGAAYYNGEGVISTDDNQAYAWFLLSEDGGNSSGRDAAQRSRSELGAAAFNDACFKVGEMYDKGEDLPKNLDAASTWYRKAADKGHARAQVSLAMQAMAAKNYRDTRQWCERAAKGGNGGGFFCLGYLDQTGLGVEKNPKSALKWYEQAASHGSNAAMQKLGEMFASGEGTRQDRAQAFVWFVHAARRNKDAIAAAASLRASMNPKEWKDAEKMLKAQGLDPQQITEILSEAKR
jgi:TPR repeat protein